MSETLHVLIGGPRHREHYRVPDGMEAVQIPDPSGWEERLAISVYRLARLAGPGGSRPVEFYAHDGLSADKACSLAWEYLLDRNHALEEMEIWARNRSGEIAEVLDKLAASNPTLNVAGLTAPMGWFSTRYVTQAQLARAVAELNERIDTMASQADVDALTQVVTDQGTVIAKVATDAAAAQATLQAEVLDKLAASNPTLNVAGLTAAVEANGAALAPLDPAVQALGALTPTPPAPPA